MGGVNDEILGHGADADGIEEYDNPLPDWWMGLFLVSIVFAAVYPVYHHGIAGNTQVAAYEREMAAAATRWPEADGLAALPMDSASLAAGEEIFVSTCASCHKADMTGHIGPNLIDDEWIHGGDEASVLKTVMEGIAAKGMPAWGAILGPAKVQQVSAYVMSKQGSVPPEAPGDIVPPAGDGNAVDGSEVYATHCAACHLPDLSGLVGPDLTDDEWLHGGELAQIQTTITEGVPEKGMISWKPILSPAEIEAVARFVHNGGKAE